MAPFIGVSFLLQKKRRHPTIEENKGRIPQPSRFAAFLEIVNQV